MQMGASRIPSRSFKAQAGHFLIEIIKTSLDYMKRYLNSIQPARHRIFFPLRGAIEGAMAITTDKVLVDCSLEEGDHGCYGELMDFGLSM
jgi:hypothetical protein